MRKIFFIAFMAMSTAVFGQITSAKLTASGLTCSMCSKSIYKALTKVPFVQTVDADIKGSSYSITFKQGAYVVIDDLKKAVEGAGFSVAALQVTAKFSNVAVANDAHIVYAGSNFHFLSVEKQLLNGNKTLTIVDKNFLPAADFKKYSRQTKMKCVETGTMQACCSQQGASGRIYHVTI